MEGSRLASRFWLLVCCISFIASALTWGERQASPGAHAGRTPIAAPEEVESATNAATEPPAPPAPAEPPAPASVATPAAAPRALLAAPEAGTTVLRCTLRGRVTYVSPSSACPEGASVKLTVLPR